MSAQHDIAWADDEVAGFHCPHAPHRDDVQTISLGDDKSCLWCHATVRLHWGVYVEVVRE